MMRRSPRTARLRLRTQLRRAKGNIAATARLMNVSEDSVFRWTLRLGLVDELRKLRRTVGYMPSDRDTLGCRVSPAGRASTRT